MSRAPLPLVLLGAFCLWLTAALAASQAQRALLAVDAIRPGMTGYGLSVFRGDVPERFDVEVIDVLHKFRPDQDLVLIRTKHALLDQANTVAGMSGSPIYIDGKLIGAYAYGWSFGKEPVAGVTPIANMLAEIDRPIDPHIWKALGTLPLTAAATQRPGLQGGRATRANAFAGLRTQATRFGAAIETRYGRALPAATPLLLSGMGERALELLGTEFEHFGLMPVQAGGGAGKATKTPKAARFVDGGSIGVQLVRGDVNAMAVGTVTHVAGKRLVAFGHPMLNAGQVALPTCTARVVHVLSSQIRSFKMAEPVAPLGALVHDRQSAIVVDQQMQADFIPLRLRIHGVPALPRSEWNMEVASNRLLTPGLVVSALVNALETSVADRTDTVYEVDSRVAITGHPEQRLRDVMYTPSGVSDATGLSRLRMFNLLNMAYANPFEDSRVTRIDVDIQVKFERDLVTIVDAQLPGDSVDPGKSVNVAVTLRHFDESERVELISVPIPLSAAGENVEISIEPGDEVEIEQPKPNNLDDLLRGLAGRYSGTALVVSTKLPAQGVKLRGQLVSSLPGSALDTLQPVNQADRGSTFATVVRKELELGHAVTGSAKLKLNVRPEPLR